MTQHVAPVMRIDGQLAQARSKCWADHNALGRMNQGRFASFCTMASDIQAVDAVMQVNRLLTESSIPWNSQVKFNPWP